MNPSFTTFDMAMICAVIASTRPIEYYSLDRAHLLDRRDMAMSLTHAGLIAYTYILNVAMWSNMTEGDF